MKPSSQPPRTPSRLTDSVHHQLSMYALAASAAGVGVLAVAQPAEARIVYTATHRVLNGPRGRLGIDLNHDRITDFSLTQTYSCDIFRCSDGLGVVGRGSNGKNAAAVGRRFLALAMRTGGRIGSGRRFLSGNRAMVSILNWGTGISQSGYWFNVTKRYLGLRFEIKGRTHFGWARLNVKVQGTKTTATLTGYAYETIPNKPIIAGKTKGTDVIVEPATLGRLALGRK